ncbi:MAG: arylsulfatase [Verrucomicrobiota bacterium]
MRFLSILSALALGVTAICQAEQKPNIVIVITDDQGYGDLSCHGHPSLKTPALDKLASESVRLDDYHVAPTCSPTRCALLTGHWTNRTGVWHTIMGRSMLRENEVTVGTIFKNAGYATGMFGKWHLGDNYPFRPEDRGFSEVLRHGGGGVGQTPDYWDNAYFDDTYFYNGKPEKTEGYCTDVFFNYAKKFVAKQVEEKKPFLAYISTNAPHGPNHAPPEYAEPYLEQYGESVAHFFGMIANIDDNVKWMREFLEEQGVADNTIFIFTTDNGTASGRKAFDGGMRGAKGSEYDGGHRVPFFIHWPKGELTGGRMVDTITAHVDVVPTLIDLCDVPAPENVKFDGVSIRPLMDESAKDWPDRILVTDSQRVKDPIKWRKSSVMTNQWRLVNEKELYDIEKDPKQEKNIAADHPEVVARLTKFYNEWWAEIEPTFGEPARIIIGNDAENPSRLTSHDWITEGSVPWNQRHIRNADAKPGNIGFWFLKVDQDGEYEIEIRRWPKEGEVATESIVAAIAAGEDVPGVQAFRAVPGEAIKGAKTARIIISGEEKSVDVPEGADHVTFKLPLKAGPNQLEAHFLSENGDVTGAYYAYIKRL